MKLRDNYEGNYQGDGVPRFDVAYLVLSSASAQTPIKIAGADEAALWDADSPVDISGWGTTSESPFSATVDTLRAATVAVIGDSTCSGDYGSDFDSATMVCAGFQSGGVDSCTGDSGGPLEAPLEGGGYRLVGITGWGEGCAEAGFPGVYTRVAGPTMHALIQADVSTLESLYGLPPESIFGSGGLPLGSASPAAVQPFSSAEKPRCKRVGKKKKKKKTKRHCGKRINSKALKRCKRINQKKKRRRCVKRVKAKARARA